MDNNLRFRSQFGNDDYAQLDRWSTCKTSPNDSHSLIYTSDYGSYSSQESNHSGTTYSNLADCEEALHSSPTISYDIPPSQLYGRMETRRDKPLPPPRMTSKPQSKSPRFQEMGKPKKISFDDSSMTKSKTKDNEEAIPSFATLPRKKKLRNNTKVNTPSTPTTSQVTWMKDVAQKAETIHYPTVTTPGNGFKKPQGILKNKSEEPKKSGDLTGYIQRDKVQKILAKQRQALSRPSNISSPPYRSMPSLTPRQQGEPQQAAKAWEYNHADGSSSSTAQVIGVIEPSSDGSPQQFFHHVKQNSNETEFEFPPPPTDHDIEQIMSSPDAANGASIAKKKDFTPLQLACSKQPPTHNISRKPALLSSRGKTDTVGANSKPPVPLRMDKLHTHSNYSRDSRPVNHSQKPESENSMKTPIPKAIVPPRRVVTLKNLKLNAPSPNSQTANAEKLFPMQDPLANNTNDIVLPPPPQFQENTTPLAAQYPSYGDYEVLSPDASYQFNGHPLTPPSYVPYNQYNYHQKIAVDQLGNSLNEKLMFSKEHNSSSTNNNTGLTYSPLVSHNINGFPTQSWHYDSKSLGRGHTVSHHHQYSTEL